MDEQHATPSPDALARVKRAGWKAIDEVAQLRPQHRHEHPPVRNVNVDFDEGLTLGQRVADGVAATIGSWRFIIFQSAVLALWVALNAVAWTQHWDPYPFILLNLMLSFQAAYAAPIIMMSQNRQAMKDRLAAEHDFQINLKAEDEVRAILRHLEYQDELILQILHRLAEREPVTADTGPAGEGQR
jgi:uncharacterized membrane protein